jgi:cytidylate kinase
MGIVALTRELGSMGTYIGERLAERRSYRYVRREILAEAARFGEVSEDQLVEAVEGGPSLWERLAEPGHRSYLHVAASVLEFAAADDVVLVGRWSTMLLRGVRHAARVRVCAPLELRVRRLMERMKISHPEARALAERYDQGVRMRIRQYFDVEWEDGGLYDLVINTERVSVDEACAHIDRLLDSDEFRADEASRQDVRDRALAARVAEALKMNTQTSRVAAHVSAHRGVVTLDGLVFSPEERDASVGVAKGVTGVSAVSSSMHVARASS